MRVIIAGGGTGGHVIPALAIAQELQSRYNAEVLFIGTARGIETRLVPAAGFQLELITVGALNRVDLATRLKTLFDLPRAIAQSARIISEFRPDVMIGVGGYASGPAMIAASFMNVPMMAFEPNVIPGIANRLVAPMVRAAAVHFPATQRYFRNAVVTGVPVRREFFRCARTSAGRAANAAGLRRQPGSARHQCRRHGVARGSWHRSFREFTSSTRPAKRTTKRHWLPPRLREFPLRCRLLSTTCQELSRVPICWYAAPEPAPSRKSRLQGSRRFSFRYQPRRTIISVTMPRPWLTGAPHCCCPRLSSPPIVLRTRSQRCCVTVPD